MRRGKKTLYQRISAFALSVCLLASSMDFTVLAAGTRCNHEHDVSCGYRAAVEGHPCKWEGTVSDGNAAASHEHDENCGYVEAKEAQPCNKGGIVSEEDAAKNHKHDESCGFIESSEGHPCKWEGTVSDGDAAESHEHDEDCGYEAPTEGHPCNYIDNLHTAHDEECGYVEAVEGHPCNFINSLHTIHDTECGYVEAVPASPCLHVHNAACGGLQPVEVNITWNAQSYTYITSVEQIMAYRQSASFITDIIGQYKEQWIQTTFGLGGYSVTTQDMPNASVTQSADFVNGGRYVRLSYTVTAGSTAITAGKMAVHSDVQIGEDDHATIKVIKDSSGSRVIGLSMVSVSSTRPASNATLGAGIGAQYNLYFRGTGGVTDVSTYWFGSYSARTQNCYNQIPQSQEQLVSTDSGLAISWQNIELAPGESKTYSIIIGVGEAAEPPKWGGNEEVPSIRLMLDAELPDRNTVNVVANIKDQTGVIDSIYYTIDDGAENKLLDSLATGEDQTVRGIIELPELDPSTRHKVLLWIANSKGAVSEAVEKWIEVDEDGNIVVDDHEHVYEERERKDPTCTEEGYVVFVCQECHGRDIVRESMLGHEFSEYVYNNDATYEHDGTETATCVRGCKDTRTKLNTKLIPAEDKVISGDIIGEKDMSYESVTAKLVGINGMGGKEYPATVTGENSLYHYQASAPADNYNLVVTAVKKDGTVVTVTSLVKLIENMTKDIVLPEGEKNSRVIIREGARTVLVGELDNIANASGTQEDVVDVVFTVDERTEKTADGAQQIKEASEDRILEYLDFKLTLQINENPPEDIGDKNTQLLPIIVPFERGNKENIAVYRYHKGDVLRLTETPNENGEYIEILGDSILVNAMKFSTYAIGYTLPKKEEVYTDTDEFVQYHEFVSHGIPEPKTGVSGNAVPWASVGMIAGFTYLLDLFAEKKSISLAMTEEQKNNVIARIVKRAKHKNRFVRYLAIGIIFMILLFYYLIGKHLAVKDELEELQLEW